MFERLADPGLRAHFVGLVANVLLAIMKFVVGWIAVSEALTADGFNSAGDVLATGIGAVGYVYARKPPDEDHHYGHGNAESVAGLIIGCVLFATGVFITIEGLRALLAGHSPPPGSAALWAAGVTIVVKEALYRYAVRVGRACHSPSLLASARDHRADVLVSATVFGGIAGARTGIPALDPAIAIVVGLYVVWFAAAPIRSNTAVLMDQAPALMRDAIRDVVAKDPDVHGVRDIRVHTLGSYHVVDLEIFLDDELSLHDAHAIAHRVADRVRGDVARVEDVTVHVNPSGTHAEESG